MQFPWRGSAHRSELMRCIKSLRETPWQRVPSWTSALSCATPTIVCCVVLRRICGASSKSNGTCILNAQKLRIIVGGMVAKFPLGGVASVCRFMPRGGRFTRAVTLRLLHERSAGGPVSAHTGDHQVFHLVRTGCVGRVLNASGLVLFSQLNVTKARGIFSQAWQPCPKGP